MRQLSELTPFVEQLATAAGELILQKYYEPRQTQHKGYRDLVTDADFASQKLITTEIMKRFPQDGFLTEEEDSTLPTDGELIWIIDPVDGTSNYSRQIPNYCVSIAVAKKSNNQLDVQAGAVYDPMQKELFSASKGGGARCNNKPLAVNNIDTPSEAIFSLDWSRGGHNRQATLDILGEVAHQVRTIRAVGTAALAMCWIASGRLDSYLNYHISAWDVAASQLILHEAGGRVSDFEGRSWHWEQRHCFASNGHIHQDIRAYIQKAQGNNLGNITH